MSRHAVAVAQTPFSMLQVNVPPEWFSSCYFKVKLLHNVALKKPTDTNKIRYGAVFNERVLRYLSVSVYRANCDTPWSYRVGHYLKT